MNQTDSKEKDESNKHIGEKNQQERGELRRWRIGVIILTDRVGSSKRCRGSARDTIIHRGRGLLRFLTQSGGPASVRDTSERGELQRVWDKTNLGERGVTIRAKGVESLRFNWKVLYSS